MKSIVFFCFAVATLQTFATERARVTFWREGQRINWDRCEPGWSIENVRLIHPRGEEAEPPQSRLEITIKYEGMKPTTHVITVEQARERGFSLDGLRHRLLTDSYKSIIALKLEPDGTVLDFILQLHCELPLLRTQ